MNQVAPYFEPLPLAEPAISDTGAIGKSELAAHYGVHLNTLAKWLHGPQLLPLLKAAGYSKSAKILTPRQARIARAVLE